MLNGNSPPILTDKNARVSHLAEALLSPRNRVSPAAARRPPNQILAEAISVYQFQTPLIYLGGKGKLGMNTEHCRLDNEPLFNEKGATMVEYGLLAACVAVVVISSVSFVGKSTNATFYEVGEKVIAGTVIPGDDQDPI